MVLHCTKPSKNLRKHVSELPTYGQKGKYLSSISLFPKSKMIHWIISLTFLGWEIVNAKQVPKGILCCGFGGASGLKANVIGLWPKDRAVPLRLGKACQKPAQSHHHAVVGWTRLREYHRSRQEMPRTGSYPYWTFITHRALFKARAMSS